MHRPPLLLAIALLVVACGGSAGPDPSLTDPAGPGGPATSEDAAPTAPETAAPMTARPDDAPPMPGGLCPDDDAGCVEAASTADGDAGAACVVGATECADDPSNGVDQARPVPLSDTLPPAATPLVRGRTDGATGALVTSAAVSPTGVALTVRAAPCDVLEDVVVVESRDEVRVLVLTGSPADGTCDGTDEPRRVDVRLDAPLGDRALLDLAG